MSMLEHAASSIFRRHLGNVLALDRIAARILWHVKVGGVMNNAADHL